MTHSDLRDLCNRFFDAYQDGHVAEIAEIVAEDCVIRLVPLDRDQGRAELLAGMRTHLPRQRRRTYNDRQIDTFDGGFVIRYTLNLTEVSGRKSHNTVCIVCDCHDGRIVRLVEYIDPNKWPFVPLMIEKQRQAKRRRKSLKGAADDA